MTTAPDPPTQGWLQRHRMIITPLMFLLPGIAFFAVYVISPIFQSFYISAFEWNGLGSLSEQGEFVGMQNYRELMSDRNFEVSLWNNLKWLVLYLLAIPGGLFIALFLNQTIAGIRLYKSLFFFPFVISQVVVGLVFSWFYLPNVGLLNVVLGWFGSEVNVLGNPDLATYGIIAAGLWPQTAYCMILYLTGLNAVDPEQIEAARLVVYKAAWAKDQGHLDNGLDVAQAKYLAGEAAVKAANNAMRILGAYGYSTEYPVARFYRDAPTYTMVEGSANICKWIIALDQLGIRKANR